MGLRHSGCNGVSAAAVLAAVVVSALLSEGTAYAQAGDDVATAHVGAVREPPLRVTGGTIAAALRDERSANEPTSAPPNSIRRSLATLDDSAAVLSKSRQPARAARGSSVGRKVAGGVFGGVAGFYAGGYLGARIEGDRCQCDLAGLKGAIIGAPIGAVVGAILGATFF